VHSVTNLERNEPPVGHFSATFIGLGETQRLEHEPGKPEWLFTAELSFRRDSTTELKQHVRWLGSRKALDAGMLVSRDEPPVVTLLLAGRAINAEGIHGIVAHGLGDLDGDEFVDLVLLERPFLDCCAAPGDIEATLYRSHDGDRVGRAKLFSPAEMSTLIERCFAKNAADLFEPKRWRIQVAHGRARVALTGRGGCAHTWDIALENGSVSVSSSGGGR